MNSIIAEKEQGFTKLKAYRDYRDPSDAMAYERKLAEALDELAGKTPDLFGTATLDLRAVPGLARRQVA